MTAPTSKAKRATVIRLVILGLLSVSNLLLILLVIPKFREIYRDALPGMRLPAATLFILDYRILLALVAMAWMGAGIVSVRQGNRFALVVILCGMLWCFLQTGLIIYGLFVPLVGMPGGMSDATNGP